MAEINAAYATLTRPDATTRHQGHRRSGGSGARREPATPRAHEAGIPPSPRTAPVTGRLDTTHTFQPRNQTTTPPGVRQPLTGHPPLRADRSRPELRASEPSGPLERDRLADHTPATPPSLDEALEVQLAFGKFHGHTLGEVAAFEPSYIDWLAGTLRREPEIALAARVICEELDRQGIRRAHRPARQGWQSSPFH